MERRSTRRDGWALLTFVLAGGALLGAILAVGFGSRAIEESKRNPNTPGGPAAATAPVPATTMVHLSEFAIEPKQITVAVGGTLQVMNTGTMPHDLAVNETTRATKMIDPGRSDDLSLAGLSPAECRATSRREWSRPFTSPTLPTFRPRLGQA